MDSTECLCYHFTVRIDLDNLPADIPLLHQIIRELLEEFRRRGTELTKVKERLRQLLKRVYSKSSERLDERQLRLFVEKLVGDDEDKVQTAEGAEPPAPEPPSSKGASGQEDQKPKEGHGRRKLPDSLPRDTVTLDPDKSELVCSCGRDLEKIGEDVSEQLDYQPAMFRVKRRVRSKWGCRRCREGVVTAPVPAMPIEKGLATAGLISNVIVSKFADHLPLNRQSRIFGRHGVALSPSTLGGWVQTGAGLLVPIAAAMQARILTGRQAYLDGTPVPVLDKSRNHTREAHVWVVAGDSQNPFVTYVYTPTKGFGPVAELLAGFEGFLQADASPSFDCLYESGKILEVGCRAHARRKIYETLPAGGLSALTALAYIRQLYDVEREAKAKNLGEEAILELRQQKSVPILVGFNAWVDEELRRTLPESAFGKALAYGFNHRTALDRYVEHGFLDIDNNFSERQLRRLAVGRANWTFAGSDRAGHDAATLYSLVATCERHGIDPWAYLTDVLELVSTHPANRIEELFPDAWARRRGLTVPGTGSSVGPPVLAARAATALAPPERLETS